MQDDSPVIIDNGSFTIKTGLVSEDMPHAVFPNLIGYPKYSSHIMGLIPTKNHYFA